MIQTMVVGVIVAGSSVYALWTLFPKAPRSRLAAQLLKLPHPQWLAKPLALAAKRQGGCGCDGCDRSELSVQRSKKSQTHTTQPAHKSGSATFRPLVFHPRAAASKAVQTKSS